MSKKDTTKELLHLIDQGGDKKYPAAQLVKDDPTTAAYISKLVISNNPVARQAQKDQHHHTLASNRMAEISRSVQNRLTDNENIIQLFPDLELCIQILVSSILSPKDMTSQELLYKTKESILPSHVTAKMIDVVKDHLENYYGFKKNMPHVLRKALAETGSDIMAVIPESSVDEIINGHRFIGTEALEGSLFNRGSQDILPMGFLGNVTKETGGPRYKNLVFSTESLHQSRRAFNPLFSEEGVANPDNPFHWVSVADNFEFLKMPKIIEKNNEIKVQNLIGRRGYLSREDRRLSDQEIQNRLYKSPNTGSLTFIPVKPQQDTYRKSIGRPLVMTLPSEAVIPVYVPGSPKDHIGYFVLVDDEGNPVSRHSSRVSINNLGGQITDAAQPITGFLLQKARNNLTNNDLQNLTLDQAATIYGAIVQKELVARIKNGIYGSNVEIGDNQEIYRIMLSTALANQYTKLLYIPKELVSYFAFSYHPNGIGKSLFDNLKIIISLQAILLFADIMAASKNSIAQTHVNVTFDEQDPDPQKTAEMLIHEITRLRGTYFPLGINSPVDLADWIQRAGLEFTFEGHPDFPNTKLDFETRRLDHNRPDTDLRDLLNKRIYMAFGLDPETVDSSRGPDFATTIVRNNLLMSKRIAVYQETVIDVGSERARIIIRNDMNLQEDLAKIIREDFDDIKEYVTRKELLENVTEVDDTFIDVIITMFTKSLLLDLPKPDITTMETQTDAYNIYSEALDKVIGDAILDTTIATTDLTGNIGNNIDAIKAACKAYFLRKWMAENNYLTELFDFVNTDEEGNPQVNLSEAMKSHMEGLIKTAAEYVVQVSKAKKIADQALEKTGMEGSGGFGGDSFGSGDGFGGMNDFGDGDTTDLDTETPPEEAGPTDEEGSSEPSDEEEKKEE